MRLFSIIYKKAIPVLLCVVLALPLFLFSGCADNAKFTLYYGVKKAPQNLDPQLAQNDSELLFARNCFSGLYKLDSNDNPVPDLVTSCDVSSDGLVYTFKIKGNSWSDGSKVTAADFRFAILRASDPILKAPGVGYLTNIVGVNDRLQGFSNELGVSAPDNETLIIKLTKPDSNFFLKLTKPVFMPCNELFFTKCGGKYGLSKEHILTNGNYKVLKWTNEKMIELQRVAESDLNGTSVKNVVLSESQSGKLNSLRIINKEIGITSVSGEDYTNINRSDFNIDVSYRKNYCICFNPETDIGKNQMLLEAFAQSIDRVYIKQNMSDRYSVAYSIIPKDSLVLQSSPLGDVGIRDYAYETEYARSRSLFLQAVKSFRNSKLPTIEILCPDMAEIKSILQNAIYGWQSNLGVVVNIKTVSSEQELINLYKNGQYSVALLPLEGSADEILNLVSDSVSSFEFHNALDQLNATDNIAAARSLTVSAANVLSNESSLIPIVSVPTANIHSNEYKGVYFSKIDGTVDFSIIYK